MEERLNLFQKLAKIRDIADVVSKDKRGYNYSYADITEILAKVKAGMKKYGVSLVPIIVPGTSSVQQNVMVNTKFDKTGKQYDQTVTEMLFDAEMLFKWVNDENPAECLDVPWHITGSQPDPSQSMGGALTYSTRYFLTNFFQIAQDNDVDAYRSKQKEAAASEDREIADGIIQKFDETLKLYLSDHPGKKEEIQKFLSRYAKEGKYRAIKEPALAAKLLEDFNKTYVTKE